MAQNSNIEWTDHTFNPWVGCAKVSPGCKNCYAETLMDKRHGRVQWGIHGTRSRTSAANWKLPLRWNREAEYKPFVCNVCGVRSTGMGGAGECEHIASGAPVLVQQRPRVFCASLADVFEDRPDLVEWRADLFELIAATPNLDWLLLTKRPENIERMWPEVETGIDQVTTTKVRFYNVGLGTSVEDQAAADERIPHLLKAAYLCRYAFLSCEPLLGPVDLQLQGRNLGILERNEQVSWVIAGGESGHGARPMHPDWARSLRDQCKAAGVPFLFKQWGEYAPAIAHLRTDEKYVNEVRWLADGRQVAFKQYSYPDRVNITNPNARPHCFSNGDIMAYRIGKKAAGRLLDGVEHNEFPA